METSITPAKSASRWRFRGPNGVRVGYSIVIFLVIVGILEFAGTLGLARAFHLSAAPSGPIPPAMGFSFESMPAVVLLLAVSIMAKIERRSILDYGLRDSIAASRYLTGAFFGLLVLSLLVLILDSAGYFVFDGLAGDRNETLLNGIVWWITFTCTGIGEELLFRGYLQSTLSRIMGFWPAAVLCSVLFCLAHLNNSGEALIGIAQVFIAGMVFATIRRFSGSLWLGIGVHAGWDWGQSFFYGTADSGLVVEGHLFNTHPTGDILLSGGPVGPEGSVLAAPVVVLSLCIMLVVSRRVGWLQWSRTAPSP